MKLGIILILLLLAPLIISIPSIHAVSVQYLTDVSFDFLSSDELANFKNGTLAGTYASLATFTVSGGKLNITNQETSDAFLVLERSLCGYVEVILDQGEIFVLSNWNASPSPNLAGYVVKKDTNGVVVYALNGTQKSALASISTTQTKIFITVEDGKFRVDLGDGTGVYEGSIQAGVIALGAGSGEQGIFDKVVLYKKVFAAGSGEQEISLGTKTITGRTPVSFSYDLSSYQNIQSVTLVVTMSAVGDEQDPYWRYYAVTINGKLLVPENQQPYSWDNYDESMGGSTGLMWRKATFKVDITSEVKTNPTGTIKVGISTARKYSWSVSVKIILVAEQEQEEGGGTQPDNQQKETIVQYVEGKEKYIMYGLGALVLILLIVLLTQPSGRRGRRGSVAPLMAFLLVIMLLGGIAAAVMAWLYPEYLTALAYGLGAIAIIILFMFFQSGRRVSIPNPVKV